MDRTRRSTKQCLENAPFYYTPVGRRDVLPTHLFVERAVLQRSTQPLLLERAVLRRSTPLVGVTRAVLLRSTRLMLVERAVLLRSTQTRG